MRITDLLSASSIDLNAKPLNKKEAIEQAVKLMAASGNITDIEAYTKQVIAREEESTTGVGEGIAIPHGKCSAVSRPGLAAMIIRDGVDYDSLDGEPVNVLFLIAAPDSEDNVHLDVLSKLSVLLMDEEFIRKLKAAKDIGEFLEVIDNADSESKSIDERLQDTGTYNAGNSDTNPADRYIVAVTSCPTGIAHTYMAAEGLEKAAKKAGCTIKIETRGSAGAKNVLTDEDIEKAECIIVAADAKVPMARFEGHKVIECQVSDGINKADELISQALSGDVPEYQVHGMGRSSDDSQAAAVKKNKSGGVGHQIYTQLMNGVSHMLPFVVGGGILIAIAFLIDGINVDMNSLSEAERANFGTITPVAALFKNIGGAAFGFMLPVLAGYIAMAIGDRPALALGFVGGYIAANGKSGFLGALVAGFAAGYIILGLRKLCDKLPEALEKIAPVLIYPVVGILVIGLGMNYVIEPVMGAINTGLNSFLVGMGSSSRIILGFVLAAMMAIDMGGPFNKAAYVFGTASIAANSVGYTIIDFANIPGSAMGLALITIVGQCVGAGDKEQAVSYTKKIIKLAYLGDWICNIILFLSAGVVSSIFNLSVEAHSIAILILRCFSVTSLFIWPLSFTLSNALRASGDATFTMLVSIFSMWIFRVGSSYVFGIMLGLGVLGVWIGMFVDWAARSVMFVWRFKSGKWLEKKSLT